MTDKMKFPKTMKEFIDSYSFKDEEQIYTNSAELIPVFRVEQALEHYEKEIKNKAIVEFAERIKFHLAGLCISSHDCLALHAMHKLRSDAIDMVERIADDYKGEKNNE